MSALACWRCGAGLDKLSLPLSRMDECPVCSVSLHVCRMCVHFDPHVTRACREDDAPDVLEKERPNFCDYFAPSADAFDGRLAAADSKARDQLEQLFGAGDESDGDQQPPSAADDLFK